MQLFRQFIARLQAWRSARRAIHIKATDVLPLMALQSAIHRDVTSSGVRVYSLCGSCGARLEASATLCEDCAQRRSRLS
jgi:ribosomal protein L40E